MSDPDFAMWVRVNPPPDLQDLVESYGGYSSIPSEAWADYDAAMERWQERRKARKWDR